MTIGNRNIPELRRSAASVPLITGAAGFLGSHIAASLLKRGFHAKLLCRGREEVTAADRIRRVLHWHGIEQMRNVEVVEGDVCKRHFGLSDDQFARLSESITEIIHCASSTSFAEKNRRLIEETNILGVRHCLDLAKLGHTAHFHHISTAYVAGKMLAECPEDLVSPPGFCNPYESSKNTAEHMVAEECAAMGVTWSIYRPSVIIGDSEHGRTLLFNAMYFPVRFFDHMQTVVRRDYGGEAGANARLLQARLEPDGTVYLPLRVDKGAPDGGLINIVPVDYVVAAFEAAYLSDSCEGVFNIVNERASPLNELLGHIKRYYQMDGLQAVGSEAFVAEPYTSLDSAFAAFASIYAPYMTDQRTFASRRVSTLLGGKRAPEIDYGLFSKCIDYARECRWRSPLRAGSEPTHHRSTAMPASE